MSTPESKATASTAPTHRVALAPRPFLVCVYVVVSLPTVRDANSPSGW